jgi:hypothetical protein
MVGDATPEAAPGAELFGACERIKTLAPPNDW